MLNKTDFLFGYDCTLHDVQLYCTCVQPDLLLLLTITKNRYNTVMQEANVIVIYIRIKNT